MKYKKFDVVKLNDNNRATILKVEKNKYFVEIVNPYGVTLDKTFISEDKIRKTIYVSKQNDLRFI